MADSRPSWLVDGEDDDAADKFLWSYKEWNDYRSPPVVWSDDWGDGNSLRAPLRGGELRISRSKDDVEQSVLWYKWPHGGRRDLARGTAKHLRTMASDLVQRGGPFGGPTSESNSRAVVYLWDTRRATYTFGAGYQFRIRFTNVQERIGTMVCVSPSGSFVPYIGGHELDLASRAVQGQPGYDETSDDFDDSCRPFSVLVHGVRRRLTYIATPGLLGYTALGSAALYLRHLNTNRASIVRVERDGRFWTLAEGSPSELIGVEVAEAGGAVPRLGRSTRVRPPSWSSWDTASMLHHVSGLHHSVRDHLQWLFHITTTMTGARTLRQVVWALVLIHMDGYRRKDFFSGPQLVRFLRKYGYLSEDPSPRARETAMRLIVEYSPLITRPTPRSKRWAVHFPEFGRPSDGVRERFRMLQQRGRRRPD